MAITADKAIKVVRRVDLPTLPAAHALSRVAAYARVSSGKDAMKHSLSAQISYYNKLYSG